ncbi:MAG: sulfatase-like hydrolase/transferase [Anaerolineales bacterium]|nr:sulfatase-like hydrolase/transferase [Anaerolineales bacterium]
MSAPNVLYIMTDQQRWDTIAALGNPCIYTPNLDRLVRRGVSFANAYSTCPVCVPARYTVRTGCEPPTTRIFSNERSRPAPGQADTMEGRCGSYLARTLAGRGYRTFGIGKFHTQPWDEDLGYQVHLHSEELYASADQRRRDAFAGWIAREHPGFDYIEALMGERTEMYYMPQVSPLPAELTVERWAADRAVEQIGADDGRPFFGFVSFIGPHPPFAPPLPFNRMYDPDRMPNPVCGDAAVDLMDEQIGWMNYAIWADDISDARARALKARYYGEISYIDDCLGRILDAVEARDDAENTLICFFSDHGDHLGDHRAWQKESFFEAACHVPFLLSWPAQLPADERSAHLVCLTDLFGIATSAAGAPELRQGQDVLGLLAGTVAPREQLVGMYGEPGAPLFKVMVRTPDWKYIYLANGGREQLFEMQGDASDLVGEQANQATERPEVVRALRQAAIAACQQPGATAALDGGDLRGFPYRERPRVRIYQFDLSRGITGFPERPEDALRARLLT